MLTFKEFSQRLIETQDLDPDYAVLRAILKDKPMDEKVIWCATKIFIYDTASEWQFLMNNNPLDGLVYGAERRKNKRHTAKQLETFLALFNLEQLPTGYPEARKYLKTFPGVGDWAAWKFCDLLERVCDHPIDFGFVDFRTAYEYPLRGLCRVNFCNDDDVKTLKDDQQYERFMLRAMILLGEVAEMKAPPFNSPSTRHIGIQELETCLCKYHSYLQGRYKVGQDTAHLIDRFWKEGIMFPDCGIKMTLDQFKLHI